MNKTIIAAVAIIATVAGVWVAKNRPSKPPSPTATYATTSTVADEPQALSEVLIPFSLPDMAGNKHNLNEWRGQVIVLNFWATWCPPCREEIPMFIALHEDYKDKGLSIIGVAIDQRDAVGDYRDTLHISYPILIDEGGTMPIIMHQYGNFAGVLPYSVIIDRDGKIQNRKLGAYTREELEPMIKNLL